MTGFQLRGAIKDKRTVHVPLATRTYERILELAQSSGLKHTDVCRQMIEYALESLERPEIVSAGDETEEDAA